jgi:hypothetical protein
MTKLLIAIFLSLTLISSAQNKQTTDKDKERIDNVCDKFMQIFVDGNISEALQLLKQNSVISPSSIDSIQATVNNQVTTMFSSHGKMLSSEFISEHKVKDFIAKRFYTLKFDQYYLKFDFTLYDNGKGWKITTFDYNEDLTEILY